MSGRSIRPKPSHSDEERSIVQRRGISRNRRSHRPLRAEDAAAPAARPSRVSDRGGAARQVLKAPPHRFETSNTQRRAGGRWRKQQTGTDWEQEIIVFTACRAQRHSMALFREPSRSLRLARKESADQGSAHQEKRRASAEAASEAGRLSRRGALADSARRPKVRTAQVGTAALRRSHQGQVEQAEAALFKLHGADF